jgi:hypothetical protein
MKITENPKILDSKRLDVCLENVQASFWPFASAIFPLFIIELLGTEPAVA